MPSLFSPDGNLIKTSTAVAAGGYAPIKIGAPMGVELRTFYPGPDIKDWNNKAELMISSQVRTKPLSPPPPQRVNIMVQGYQFKDPEPIHGVAGDHYGDMMLHYTTSYTGGRVGLTVRGVELDKIGKQRFDDITSAMESVGDLAFFSSAAPYLAAANLGLKVINLLVRAFSRNDTVLHPERLDLQFAAPNGPVLQAGRYLLWNKGGKTAAAFAKEYELDDNNVLVRKDNGQSYAEKPYLVVEIDGRERVPYKDFEIGAKSAELLEVWGDKDAAKTVLNTIRGLAEQVNDADQLESIVDLLGDLEGASTDEEKKKLKEQIEAHRKLLTEDNGDFLKKVLKGQLK